VAGDVLDPPSLDLALRGVHTAYYLIHSMADSRDYAENDRRGAEAFSKAAREAGVQRIIYLGGLGEGDRLSRHLASRQEVGRILRESGVSTTEFRASIVIGSGSLSFELVRALVEKLPAMVTPSWVETPTQPIGIEDLVAYLTAAIDLPSGESVIYEIGGPDRVSYGDLMREYARLRGLRRVMVRVPVLTPRLSSLWLALVSPVYASVGRELIDGVRNTTVVHDDRALSDFKVRPRGIRDVLARALANEDLEFAATRWSDALSAQRSPRDWGGVTFGSRRVDSRAAWVDCAPDVAFGPIARIGGDTGWYYGNRLWRLRGLLDLAVGGPGLRRGRRDRARAPAAPGRRDAGPWAGLASVRGDPRQRGKPHPADRALRSGGPRRAGLLVRAVGNPSARVRRDAAQHRPCRHGASPATRIQPSREADRPGET
jgi:uncharacterized protein YbjT (DUF2867 family)